MENPSERDRFDDLFQEKLTQFTPDVAPPAWADLAPRVARSVSRRFPIGQVAAIALLMVGAATYFLLEFRPDMEPLYESMAHQPVALLPTEPVGEVVTIERAERVEKAKQVNLPTTKSSQPQQIVKAQKPKQKQKHEEETREIESKPKQAESTTYVVNDLPRTTEDWVPAHQPKGRRVQMSMLASNSVTKHTSDGAGATYGLHHHPYYRSNMSEFNHLLPLRFGLQVGYDFVNRWHATSGLTYSILRSNFEVLEENGLSGTQSLHYLGIPISVYYKLLNKKGFQLYIGAGAEINLNLQSKVSYRSAADQYKMTFSDRHPVYGFGAKCGLAYRLIDRLYLYAEPEITHYVTKSSLRSYWSDQPVVFSLNIGLRTQF